MKGREILLSEMTTWYFADPLAMAIAIAKNKNRSLGFTVCFERGFRDKFKTTKQSGKALEDTLCDLLLLYIKAMFERAKFDHLEKVRSLLTSLCISTSTSARLRITILFVIVLN